MNKPYSPPRIHDLGTAVQLTRGSYPHTPETFGTTDKKSQPRRRITAKVAEPR